jgi:hypothetical protein
MWMMIKLATNGAPASTFEFVTTNTCGLHACPMRVTDANREYTITYSERFV